MVCSLTLINSILQASLTQAVPQVGLVVSLEDENHFIVCAESISYKSYSGAHWHHAWPEHGSQLHDPQFCANYWRDDDGRLWLLKHRSSRGHVQHCYPRYCQDAQDHKLMYIQCKHTVYTCSI